MKEPLSEILLHKEDLKLKSLKYTQTSPSCAEKSPVLNPLLHNFCGAGKILI